MEQKGNTMKHAYLTASDDYLLWSLVSQLNHSLHNVCTRMQEITPYGEEYKDAYDKITKIGKEIDKLEEALEKCVDARDRARKEGKLI